MIDVVALFYVASKNSATPVHRYMETRNEIVFFESGEKAEESRAARTTDYESRGGIWRSGLPLEVRSIVALRVERESGVSYYELAEALSVVRQ